MKNNDTMEFYFINPDKFKITNFSYDEFDEIVKKFGYKLERNLDLHAYFAWSEIRNSISLNYILFSDTQLKSIFINSEAFNSQINYYVRLTYGKPIIEVESENLSDMLEDLSYETGMGWEAISTCGKYIIEFTDEYQHQAKCNFNIMLPQSNNNMQ